jgi:hypothetical protein
LRSALLAAIFAGLFTLIACGQGSTDAKDIRRASSGSEIGQAYLKQLTVITGALDPVKEEASAHAAATGIRTTCAALEGMSEELSKDDMSPLKAMQIHGSHRQAISETYGRIMTSFIPVQQQHRELVEALSTEMEWIGQQARLIGTARPSPARQQPDRHPFQPV